MIRPIILAVASLALAGSAGAQQSIVLQPDGMCRPKFCISLDDGSQRCATGEERSCAADRLMTGSFSCAEHPELCDEWRAGDSHISPAHERGDSSDAKAAPPPTYLDHAMAICERHLGSLWALRAKDAPPDDEFAQPCMAARAWRDAADLAFVRGVATKP